MDLQAIIFDIDGTLAETELGGHRIAFNNAFADAGLPWHWDTELYARLARIGGGRERIAAFARQCDPEMAAARGFPEFVAMLHRVKSRHYRHLVAEGAITLRDGVAALIRDADDAGIALAIATNGSIAGVHALLAGTLADRAAAFSVIACRETCARPKPAPDVYLDALIALGLPPEACLAIEDSETGLVAARAAGIATVVTPSALARGECFTGAAAVLPDLAGSADCRGLDRLRRIFARSHAPRDAGQRIAAPPARRAAAADERSPRP